MSFSLHSIAPRLARARDQRREELRVASVQRRHMASLVLSSERCVAHRELQLVRAFSTGNGRYIAERQRKLAAAKRELARHRRMQRAAA